MSRGDFAADAVTMRREERALQLIERIYEAVIEPDSWNAFLSELSEALGGAAIQLSVRVPDPDFQADPVYGHGLDPSYRPVFVKHVLQGLPWMSLDRDLFLGRFGMAAEALGDLDATNTDFFLDFMLPQGLAPEWPICHLIATESEMPLSGMVIYRRKDGPRIGTAELRLLDTLVPHLARAYALHSVLVDTRQQRRALTEVIDRIPTGVILVDADSRVVLKNRSADRILALDDGFELHEGRPKAYDPRQDKTLRAFLAAAIRTQARRGSAEGRVLSLSRPSGKRPYALMIGPLLGASPGNSVREAKAILFIADSDGDQISTTEVIETLYHLTHAEAELVRLIAEGSSLDEVAQARGVTMNTVRSQLKQVFSKTDTRRQGELVHLILSGVAALRDDSETEGG